jgi:arabinofuranosyltransferase
MVSLMLFIFLQFLIVALNAMFYWLNRHFQLDDALIYYRYIENALQGHGLVYNIGEYFNGLTSPLYTYLSLVFAYFIKNIQNSQVILNFILASFWGIVLLYYLKDKVQKIFLFLIPLFVAAHPFFSMVLGLETHLFILLSIGAMLLYEKENYFWLGIVSTLLLLTRGESVFLLAAMGLQHICSKKPLPKWHCWIIPLIILSTNYGFNKIYYEAFLPDTFSAKTNQGLSGLWGAWPIFLHAGYQIEWFFGGSRLLALIYLVLALTGSYYLCKKSEFRIIFLYLFFYTAFYVFLNIPNYHWYYSMYYFFASVFVIFSFEFFYQKLRLFRVFRNREKILYAVLIFSAAALSIPFIKLNIGLTRYSGPHSDYKKIGLWMRDTLGKESKIATIEIGTIGWYSKLYVIDILGLTHPENARYIGEKRFTEWMNHFTPNYILIHHPAKPVEQGILERAKTGEYAPDPRFHFQGYVLLKKTETAVNAPADINKNPLP